jgi:hypothetical protein
MKKIICASLFIGGLLGADIAAADPRVSGGVVFGDRNFAGSVYYNQPPMYYVRPAPVYYGQPVYYAPPRHHHHHHRHHGWHHRDHGHHGHHHGHHRGHGHHRHGGHDRD